MSISRIKAVILQELFITKGSVEVIADLFYLSIITVIVWGFISLYLAGTSNPLSGYQLLVGIILWDVIRIVQYSISIGALWNIWSKNLGNMFISPLSLTEYMTAQIISAVIKALLIFFALSFISMFFFKFNILQIGVLNLTLYFINLIIFAWAIGVIILALIFRYGKRIQALGWSLIFIFQPLSASFFPVSILPQPLQKIAFFIPVTHVFESARANLINSSTNWNEVVIMFTENIAYIIIALWFLNMMFNKSKETGQFAANET